MHGPPRAPRDRRYSTQAWRRVRELVRERDNRTCQACGRHEPEPIRRTWPVDHRDPAGPFYDPDNLQLFCPSCNASKAGMSMDEWRRRAVPKPGQQPSRPAPASPYTSEAPSIEPRPSVRPTAGDRRFLAWALELHGVSAEPTDHDHGSRWTVCPDIYTRAGAFRVCPPSCTRPVRWPRP